MGAQGHHHLDLLLLAGEKVVVSLGLAEGIQNVMNAMENPSRRE
jgi:hypothetical protein